MFQMMKVVLHWEPRAVLAGIRFADLSARGAIASCMKCFALRDAENISPIPPALQATRMRRALARVAGRDRCQARKLMF